MDRTMLPAVRESIEEIAGFIEKFLGNKDKIIPIADDTGLVSAQRNIQSLIDKEKEIKEIFKPEKSEKKAEWDKVVQEEKSWLDIIKRMRDFVEERASEWMDKVRAEVAARERAEQEEQAEKDRKILEQDKASALAAGNTEAVEEIEKAIQNTAVINVPERKVMSRSETGTISEKDVIDFFEITNHVEFIQACLAAGYGAILQVNSKTETAFKKILVDNKAIPAFPGCNFRRGYGLNINRKRGS